VEVFPTAPALWPRKILVSTLLERLKYTIKRDISIRSEGIERGVADHLCSSLLYKYIKIKIYRIITLPVVLYGCKTWSLTLRGESGLRVVEKRVLRRIFGPERDEVTGDWRKLHNKELNDLYCSPNIVRVIKARIMGWTCSMYGGGEWCIQGFGGET
jgi:hypothetical protein